MTYESDFIAWTREQAALLRSMPREGNPLDIENLAEEIEAAGRREIIEIEQKLTPLLSHLILVAIAPDEDRAVWHYGDLAGELERGLYQIEAKPCQHQYIDLPKVWSLARRSARTTLAELKSDVPKIPETCPIQLERLLSRSFDYKAALDTIQQAIEAK